VTTTGQVASKGRGSNETQHCRALFEQSSDAILANMGHALRTRLNGIIGFSELLERQSFGPLTERQLNYVQNIQVSGWCLLKLVIDIVDLSKIEVGKLLLSPEWTSLDPVVEAALCATRTLAGRKRIALRVSLQPDLPTVWVDPVRMQQVIGSLLALAVKFSPEGGSVGLTACMDEAGVCVSVTDTGSGVEESPPLEPLIEPIESSLGEQMEDEGLSLTLAKRLLEMHGGHIRVRTEARGGPTFTATIPLKRQDKEGRANAC
jgi:signal transduction histidine kinase